MHELSFMADLMRKIIAIANEEGAEKVIGVTITLGALCHLSAAHLREHFVHAARGTVAEGARLTITTLTDAQDPRAQEIVLESVEVQGEA
ncbi:MAG: hydrogenase maturation nickel metallochaperone HypA [Deltaproteobacteria bacterium]|nr:hydrogenase maturation nickel metallochaperone HypA [Deltaproteobacteria bacterium]